MMTESAAEQLSFFDPKVPCMYMWLIRTGRRSKMAELDASRARAKHNNIISKLRTTIQDFFSEL
jgi:hypothetical protein